MGKTYYDKEDGRWYRRIMINGISTLVSAGSKEVLDKLNYRQGSSQTTGATQ